MEALRQWALCVTFSAVAGAVVYILSPKGATDKTVKTVVSLFLITAILSPFITQKRIYTDFSAFSAAGSAPAAGNLGDTVNRQLDDTFCAILTAQIQSVLREMGITDGQITVLTDIDGQGSIFIKQVTVRIPEKHADMNEKVKQKIKEATGLDIETGVP